MKSGNQGVEEPVTSDALRFYVKSRWYIRNKQRKNEVKKMTYANNISERISRAARIRLLPLLLSFVLLLGGCTSETPSTQPQISGGDALQESVTRLEGELSEKEKSLADLTKELTQSKSELAALQEKAAAASAAPTPSLPSPPPTSTAALLAEAMTVVQLLSAGDMANLAPHIHPTLGVRFSAYPFVDAAADIVLTAAQISTAMSTTTQYTWGSEDGSGDPILLDYAAYHATYVYDEDYANPDVIGIDNVIGAGNTVDNLATVYNTARFVDFHFYGFDPQYSGIDWSSLRLVFELVGGNWYLVGVVHGQWTI